MTETPTTPDGDAFENWVRANGGDPVKDANKVYLKNMRDAFNAGRSQALEEAARQRPNLTDRYEAAEAELAASELTADEITPRVKGTLLNAFANGALWQFERAAAIREETEQ